MPSGAVLTSTPTVSQWLPISFHIQEAGALESSDLSTQTPLTGSVLLGAAEVGTVLAVTTSGARGWGRKSEAVVKTQTTTWGSCEELRRMGEARRPRGAHSLSDECPLKTTCTFPR